MKRVAIICAATVVMVALIGIAWNRRSASIDMPTSPKQLPPTHKGATSAPNNAYQRLFEKSAATVEASKPTLSPVDKAQKELESRLAIPIEVKRQFVRDHHESFDSYLATADKALLEEAAAKFPDEPQVQLKVLSKNLFPDERRKWIDAFKESDPDNSLANYLSAADLLKSGRTDEAIVELGQAMTKDRFDDYLTESFQNHEEFFRHAGFSTFASQLASLSEVVDLPYLSELKSLGKQVASRFERLVGEDRIEEAGELATMGLRMGQQMSLGDGSRMVISQLVGVAVEDNILSVMDPSLDYPGLPLPVEQMRSDLRDQREHLRNLVSVATDELTSHPSEQVLINYMERVKLHGEERAIKWFQRQFGE